MKKAGLLLAVCAILMIPTASSAHPGGTDASGGHNCWTNCEEWGINAGEYHYHDENDNPVQTYDNNESVFNQALAERLHGRILLQVENHGEAWYIRSSDSKRYYMKNGDVAYEMMRFFSLGISDADLATIPSVHDTTEMNESTSVCTTNTLANRLKGEILLQTEQHGEAWYVDPEKCRAIYMEDGAAAYQIMRFLGLGAVNTDLKTIPVGVTEFTESADEEEETIMSEAVTLEGSGQQATESFHLDEGLAVFTMEHSGTSHFSMTLLGGDGEYIDLLANQIGDFSGQKAVEIPDSGEYLINVSADGAWSAVIDQPQPKASQVSSAPLTLSGEGQSVSDFVNLSTGLTTFSMTHDGSSNFSIVLMNDEGEYIELLANEIDSSFDGSKAVSIPRSDIYLMDISADGKWTIEIQ